MLVVPYLSLFEWWIVNEVRANSCSCDADIIVGLVILQKDENLSNLGVYGHHNSVYRLDFIMEIEEVTDLKPTQCIQGNLYSFFKYY